MPYGKKKVCGQEQVFFMKDLAPFVFPALVAIHHAGIQVVAIVGDDEIIAQVIAVFSEFLKINGFIAGELAEGFGVEFLGHFFADKNFLEDAGELPLLAAFLAELHVQGGDGAFHGIHHVGFRVVDHPLHIVALVGFDLKIAHHHLVELVLGFYHHHFAFLVDGCHQPGGRDPEAHVAYKGKDDGVLIAGRYRKVPVAIAHLPLSCGGIDDVDEGHGRNAVGLRDDAFDECLAIA